MNVKIISPSLQNVEPIGPLEVWDDCWESVMMFMEMSRDWVYAGMGTCVGMNKQTLQWYMDVFEVKDRLLMLKDLKLMEAHALPLMNASAVD